MWTIEDVVNGHCTMDQVGSPKPGGLDTSTPKNMEAPSTDWIKSAFQGMGGRKAFVDYCKANPATMWPLLLKGGLAQFLKDDPLPKSVTELTDAEIESMSTNDLKRVVLRHIGITRKSDLGL